MRPYLFGVLLLFWALPLLAATQTVIVAPGDTVIIVAPPDSSAPTDTIIDTVFVGTGDAMRTWTMTSDVGFADTLQYALSIIDSLPRGRIRIDFPPGDTVTMAHAVYVCGSRWSLEGTGNSVIRVSFNGYAFIDTLGADNYRLSNHAFLGSAIALGVLQATQKSDAVALIENQFDGFTASSAKLIDADSSCSEWKIVGNTIHNSRPLQFKGAYSLISKNTFREMPAGGLKVRAQYNQVTDNDFYVDTDTVIAVNAMGYGSATAYNYFDIEDNRLNFSAATADCGIVAVGVGGSVDRNTLRPIWHTYVNWAPQTGIYVNAVSEQAWVSDNMILGFYDYGIFVQGLSVLDVSDNYLHGYDPSSGWPTGIFFGGRWSHIAGNVINHCWLGIDDNGDYNWLDGNSYYRTDYLEDRTGATNPQSGNYGIRKPAP